MFKNPTPGALLFLGWEAINPVLPSLLQKLSVASYLRHLMPVDIGAKGLIAVLTVETEPVAGWVATLGFTSPHSAQYCFTPAYRIRTLRRSVIRPNKPPQVWNARRGSPTFSFL